MAKTMFRVYSIIERHQQDDYWLNIGVAFPHEDGKGFNVMLQALPLHGDGKIVLREHDPKELETSQESDIGKNAVIAKNGNSDKNVGSDQRRARVS